MVQSEAVGATGGGELEPEQEPNQKPDRKDDKQLPTNGSLQRAINRRIIKKIIDSISDEYKKKYQCVQFADNMEMLMRTFGISGERLYITSGTGNIWSLKFGNISTNGEHQAIKIGDTIYDNLYPYGISYQEWSYDLGIAEMPYEFETGREQIN